MARTVSEALRGPGSIKDVLRVLMRGVSIEHLVNAGYTHWQIATVLADLLDSGFVRQEGNRLSVTTEGLKYLKDDGGGKIVWLEALDEPRIARMPVNEPYFPGGASLDAIRNRTSN